ncbi:MAG TPA: GNAT family N-acetyltransferase [Ktedonobacteraceae bacterium]|nr:GNAT family N-acetyltransferase [Ktedonobacteraceae bacterium]
MEITIRRASFPQDYTEIARVLIAESPEWAPTVEELARQDAIRDPQLHRAVFVAEDHSLESRPVVGRASVGHDQLAHREGKFNMDIRVHPDVQGQGIGSLLYQEILRHLQHFEPYELHTDVWSGHSRAIQFVTGRGFVEAWRRLDLELDVSHFDFTPYMDLEERVRANGVEIQTFAELLSKRGRTETIEKLYEVDRQLWRDIPYGEGEELSPRSLVQFVQSEIESPRFIPEACFIALHKHDGAFVGYSSLSDVGKYFVIEMTGVLPAYRGKGIAMLLKLHGIRYAQAHGNRAITTTNDSPNEAMLALNDRLGFQRQGATIRFVSFRTPQTISLGALAETNES